MSEYEYLKDDNNLKSWNRELLEVKNDNDSDIITKGRLNSIQNNICLELKYVNELCSRTVFFRYINNLNKIIKNQRQILSKYFNNNCDLPIIDQNISDIEILRNIIQLQLLILSDLEIMNNINSGNYSDIISQENVIMTIIHSIDLCYIFDIYDFYIQSH